MPKATTPKPSTLGDNLNTPFRDGMSAVFLSAKQARATRDVIHLMAAVARGQPLDESLTMAATQATAWLAAVLARTVKGDPDQPLMPGMEPDVPADRT